MVSFLEQDYPDFEVIIINDRSEDRTREIVEAIERFNFYERHCPNTRPRYGDKSTAPLNMCELSGRISKLQALALGEHYAAQKIAPCEPAKMEQ